MVITREIVEKTIAKLWLSNCSTIEIIEAVMKLKGITQTDVAQSVGCCRSRVCRFVNNKQHSKKLNKYFKSHFYIDIRAMYALEKLNKELNINLKRA